MPAGEALNEEEEDIAIAVQAARSASEPAQDSKRESAEAELLASSSKRVKTARPPSRDPVSSPVRGAPPSPSDGSVLYSPTSPREEAGGTAKPVASEMANPALESGPPADPLLPTGSLADGDSELEAPVEDGFRAESLARLARPSSDGPIPAGCSHRVVHPTNGRSPFWIATLPQGIFHNGVGSCTLVFSDRTRSEAQAKAGTYAYLMSAAAAGKVPLP